MQPQEKTKAAIGRAKERLLQNYRQQPVVLERGQGVRVWDVDGRSYLDLLGGIATCALGHCHPAVVAAVKAQADKLWHTSNVFYTLPQIELAERLTAASGLERAFFCNSGGEANEAMIKLVRRVQKDRGHPERFEIICFESSFHGRTLATVAATGQIKYQKGFEPLPVGFVHVTYGDLDAVRHAITSRTAAILAEPIQGEGGVKAAPEGFLASLRALCNEKNLLLLIDEIQTGMGRTGENFAFQRERIVPDAISLAKALGNGIPIAAMLCREEAAKSLPAGSHGSTFGGNLLAASAANVVCSLIFDPKMLQAVQEKGEYFLSGIRRLQDRMPKKIVEVRGRGLLIGVEVPHDAAGVVNRCREEGMLVNLAGESTVRLAPPFVVSHQELDEGLRILERAL